MAGSIRRAVIRRIAEDRGIPLAAAAHLYACMSAERKQAVTTAEAKRAPETAGAGRDALAKAISAKLLEPGMLKEGSPGCGRFHVTYAGEKAIAALIAAAPETTGAGREDMETTLKKLDDDSLDAIMEVIGSPKLYNDGKSMMRTWFLARLRRLWNIPPKAQEAAGAGREGQS